MSEEPAAGPAGGGDTSADPEALGRFVDAATRLRSELSERAAFLDALRARVASRSGDYAVSPMSVDGSSVDQLGALVGEWASSEAFVEAVRTALLDADTSGAGGIVVADSAAVALQLAAAGDVLAVVLVDQLVADGVDRAVAEQLAKDTTALLDADSTLSVRKAMIQAAASHMGMTPTEFEQRWRAFAMGRGEVASTLDRHYDLVAGDNGITIEVLQAVIADPDAGRGLQDAAYRLAADPALFDDLDSAASTQDIKPTGFDWALTDGAIGRADLELFPAKDAQIRLVLPWRIMLDSAADGYDLSKANGTIRPDEIDVFVRDQLIPVEVRRAVWEFYSNNNDQMVAELAPFDPTADDDGGPDLLGTDDAALGFGVATGRPRPDLLTRLDSPLSGRAPAGGGRASSGSGAVAGLAVALVADAGAVHLREWLHDQTSPGHPDTIRVLDPRSGQPIYVPVGHLAHLSPQELRHYLTRLGAIGDPPAQVPLQLIPADSAYGPRGYVDAWDGQDVSTRRRTYVDEAGKRRYEDTDDLVWEGLPLWEELAADAAHDGQITNNSRREAEVGLDLWAAGDLPGPLRRAAHPGAEFVDGAGQEWDVKAFRSRNPRGKRIFDLEKAIHHIKGELDAGEKVILDSWFLNTEDIFNIDAEIVRRGWEHDVKWWHGK